MAKRIPFAELYKAGLAEPQTPYQKRIARGVDRGLTTAQARGHARTSKGEKTISQLKRENKLPKITDRRRYQKVVNNRWVHHEFPEGSTTSDIAKYIQLIANKQDISISLRVSGTPELVGPGIDALGEWQLDTRVMIITDREVRNRRTIKSRLDKALRKLLQNYTLRNPKFILMTRTVFDND